MPESGSGIGDDSGAPDSTPDDAASAPCNDAAAGGPAVSQVLVAGLRPTPLGGAIADGTYWLTESDVYAANWEGNPEAGLPPSAPVARTLVFSGTTVLQADAISTDAGPPSTVVSTSFYSVSGTILSETLSCPFAAGASTVTAYSVVGNDLWLFPQLYSREVYTRQ